MIEIDPIFAPSIAPNIAIGLALLYLVLLAGKALLADRARRCEPEPPAPPAEEGAGVAIAQAILSGDPRLGELLEANLEALPAAQFLWLADSDDEVAQAVCRELSAREAGRRPRRRLDLLILPPPAEGHNPKLHKLELARTALREPVLLVLDDDTRMPAATLAALLRKLDRADLATSLPGYLDDGRWSSRLLAQFVNNNAALTYLPLLAFLPPITINGMAYALRRDFLDSIDGFRPLLEYLPDDLAVAERVLAAGGRIEQSARPHWVETTVRDFGHYVRMMHRWFLFALLLLRRQPLSLRAVIAGLHALPPLLLAALLAVTVLAPGPLTAGALLATLALRALGLAGLQRAVYGRSLHSPLASLASELLQPLHLLHALCWRRIVWRTRRYRVHGEQHFTVLP
jgi:ceramide glucosyltransferase